MKNVTLQLVFGLSASLAASLAMSQTNKLWEPGTFSDGEYKPSCSDCYIQQVEVFVPKTGVVVGTADPVCGDNSVVNFFDVAAAGVRAYVDPSGSGNLAEIAKHYAYQEVRNKVGGSFQSFLDANGPRTPYGNCAPLAALIPSTAEVVAIHLGDWDSVVGAGACPPGPQQECAQGWAKFLNAPEPREQQGGGQVFATTYISWSHDRDRVARMFIAYHMPPGKKPIRYE
ncbi:hypothetical protein EVC45_29935 [Paraburkholderia sp. UYCP14C]|uniref:hypothetical protein n=1 Tax=Paraburkholderia sp. UYCP14C TaxID=2511130 RepID=UPI00102113FB|nr:hypothetical protein [Paraburkholderia sp. UYCP14C]RZF26073.1 hypothetical protein EVC45_29935 [Paraburkholderia sp. UYCP14C]